MGDILVGTSSWTDKTLLASGWYPPTVDTPAKRLAYYAKQFPMVEVDATYYSRPAAIYKDLRPETDKKNLYPTDLPPQAYEEIWTRFLTALDPLVDAGKLGVIMFQFPPWFTIRRANKEFIKEVAARCAPLRVAVELRHASWFDGDNQEETLQ